MGKFIVFTFLMLGWAFYEMSGGADFVPEERQVAEVEPEAPAPEVTRAAGTATLISLSLPAREVTPAPEVTAEPVAAAVIAAPQPVTEAPEADAPEAVVEQVVQQAASPALDLRFVDAARVNMRAGPGTNFTVVAAFDRGTEAEVMLVNGDGWAQIRIPATGQTGWMAERLLTDG